MNPNVSGPLNAGNAGLHGLGSRAPAEADEAGEWNGVQVTSRTTPESLLADAAEEMTFSASEEVEKDVTDRKNVKKKNTHERLKVNPPPEVSEKLKRNLASRMGKLREALAAAEGNPARFRESLEEIFPDPTERHAALLELRGEMENQPSLAAMLDREIESLEAAEASAIQAGYNIADVAAGAVGEGAEAFALYRKTVLGDGDAARVLDMVLEKADGGDFVETLDFLSRSIGADLSAATPSTDKNDLEAMNSDLFNLRALGVFAREFEAEVGGLRERHGLPPLVGAGKDILSVLVRNKDSRILQLDSLKTTLGLQKESNPAYDVQALTRTHMLAHKMPLRLFADADSRIRLLDGVQKFVDAAVDFEESLLDGGE